MKKNLVVIDDISSFHKNRNTILGNKKYWRYVATILALMLPQKVTLKNGNGSYPLSIKVLM